MSCCRKKSLSVRNYLYGVNGKTPIPVNAIAPAVSGSTTLGSVLTGTNGTWINNPTSFTYQWYRNGVAIPGATSITYTTVLADSSASITLRVIAINAGGSSLPATSNAIALPSYAPVNTVAPAITGNNIVGQILSCSTGTWTNSPSFTYQWKRNGVNISGATNNTYTLVQADAGNAANISCTVTATNTVGSASANSNTYVQIFDADAWAFITEAQTVASAIMGTRQRDELNYVHLFLKGQIVGGINVYTIWKAAGVFWRADIPINDTTANSGVYTMNLLNPTEKGTFVGMVAGDFTINGVIGGSGKYFNVGKAPSAFSQNTISHYMYSRTNVMNANISFGCSNAAGDPANVTSVAMVTKFTDGRLYGKVNRTTGYDINGFTLTDTLGFIGIERNGTTVNLIKNGSIINTAAGTTSAAPPTFNMYGHANNGGGTAAFFDNRQLCGFIWFLPVLSASEKTALYTIVQHLQTNIIPGGRNV